mmetsp:Transcript_34674/g.73866  ORF Transcript_34674/g.73866 Transcript_34674/m.73866 type:complete len:363 (+) Transcript_34674:2596-3684(+)
MVFVVHGIHKALVGRVSCACSHAAQLAHLKRHSGFLAPHDPHPVEEGVQSVHETGLKPCTHCRACGLKPFAHALPPPMLRRHKVDLQEVGFRGPEASVRSFRSVPQVPEPNDDETHEVAEDVVEAAILRRLHLDNVLGPRHELDAEDGAGHDARQAIALRPHRVLLGLLPLSAATVRCPSPDPPSLGPHPRDVFPPRDSVGHGVVVAPTAVPHRVSPEAKRQLHLSGQILDDDGHTAGAQLHGVGQCDVCEGFDDGTRRVEHWAHRPRDEQHIHIVEEGLSLREACRYSAARGPRTASAGPILSIEARRSKGGDLHLRIRPDFDALVVRQHCDSVLDDTVQTLLDDSEPHRVGSSGHNGGKR